MIDEPARGGFPEPGFYALPGIDQARAYLRRLVPRPPLSHLLGIRVTQVGAGTATCTMPASPWLQAATGVVDAAAVVEVAMSLAVLTTAPPGARGADGRGHLHTLPAVHARERDPDRPGQGREQRSDVHLQRGAGRGRPGSRGYARLRSGGGGGRRSPRRRPAGDIAAAPVPEPRYHSPDPHRRPLPPGVGVVPPGSFEQDDLLSLAKKMLSGEYPEAAGLGRSSALTTWRSRSAGLGS